MACARKEDPKAKLEGYRALFLGDVIEALKKDGWKLISAKDAFTDPVYQTEPDVLPAGESIVWATGKNRISTLKCYAIQPKTAPMKKKKWIS